jgi:hypothetical protein
MGVARVARRARPAHPSGTEQEESMNGRPWMGFGLFMEQRIALHITPCLRRSREQRPDGDPSAPWRERRRATTPGDERRVDGPIGGEDAPQSSGERA